MSVNELSEVNKMFKTRNLLHINMFLIRFLAVFIMICVSTNVVSDFFMTYQNLIRQIGAILIIFFGLVIVGLLNFNFLMRYRRVTFKNRPAGFVGSFLIGMAFSMGWKAFMGCILMFVISIDSS